ncbi:hypothetical protein ABIE67_000612 [Streptomyces sp. V4I8]|uniref:hypothetical protein n=1 Tax=Streptomyces sp. V4I8 TaxID=3156469 RepID=UPI003519D71F
MIYRSAHKSLNHRADTTALQAAALERASEHHGGPVLKDVPQQTRNSELPQHS